MGSESKRFAIKTFLWRFLLKQIGYPLNTGQSACVDVAVAWANGSIVNPTLMPSSVGCEKHATQPTKL